MVILLFANRRLLPPLLAFSRRLAGSNMAIILLITKAGNSGFSPP